MKTSSPRPSSKKLIKSGKHAKLWPGQPNPNSDGNGGGGKKNKNKNKTQSNANNQPNNDNPEPEGGEVDSPPLSAENKTEPL